MVWVLPLGIFPQTKAAMSDYEPSLCLSVCEIECSRHIKNLLLQSCQNAARMGAFLGG